MAAERGERVRREDLPPARYSYDYKHDLLDAARGKARDRKCVHYPPARPGGNPDIGQTRAAQQRAKTHCPQGHELTPDNVYWRGPDKKNRQRKTCTRERAHKRYWDGRTATEVPQAE